MGGSGASNPHLLCLLGLPPRPFCLQIGVTEPLVHAERLFGGFVLIYLPQRDGKVVWFGGCLQGRLRGGEGNRVLGWKSEGEWRCGKGPAAPAGSHVLLRQGQGPGAVGRAGQCPPHLPGRLGGDERLREGLVLACASLISL